MILFVRMRKFREMRIARAEVTVAAVTGTSDAPTAVSETLVFRFLQGMEGGSMCR